MKRVLVLAGFVALPLVAGFGGSYFTIPAVESWYPTLVKPWFSPPNELFAPVWTLLYLLMGLASYLVWRSKPSKTRDYALEVYGIQLVANYLWSVIFFGLRSPLLGLVTISVLWFLIVWTMTLFWKHSRTAVYLLVPYLLWVSFATALNGAIFALN